VPKCAATQFHLQIHKAAAQNKNKKSPVDVEIDTPYKAYGSGTHMNIDQLASHIHSKFIEKTFPAIFKKKWRQKFCLNLIIKKKIIAQLIYGIPSHLKHGSRSIQKFR
jgi:hypothetical protein